MVKRFAVVVWWIGTLWFIGAVVAIPITIAETERNQLAAALAIAGILAAFGVVCWTLVFVLAGTFRRPPPTE